MLTNTALLKGVIHDSGLKLGYLADRLNMSYRWLQYKIDGKVEFKASEIVTLCEALHLDTDQMHEIFFCADVEKDSTGGTE